MRHKLSAFSPLLLPYRCLSPSYFSPSVSLKYITLQLSLVEKGSVISLYFLKYLWRRLNRFVFPSGGLKLLEWSWWICASSCRCTHRCPAMGCLWRSSFILLAIHSDFMWMHLLVFMVWANTLVFHLQFTIRLCKNSSCTQTLSEVFINCFLANKLTNPCFSFHLELDNIMIFYFMRLYIILCFGYHDMA